MKGNWAVGIGVALGSGFIFPLALHFFTAVKINTNDADRAAPVYMQHSESIKTIFPQQIENRERRITLRYTKAGDDRSDINDEVFYLPEFKKYFTYEQFDRGYMDTRDNELNGHEVMMRINKDDLADPLLGSKQKPVPVFNIWPASPLVIQNLKTSLPDTLYPNFNQNSYKYNLHMYLKYVMTKDEFQKRFDKTD